jgi:hypothetical protein
VTARLLDHRVPVHVREKAQAEPLRIAGVCKKKSITMGLFIKQDKTTREFEVTFFKKVVVYL